MIQRGCKEWQMTGNWKVMTVIVHQKVGLAQWGGQFAEEKVNGHVCWENNMVSKSCIVIRHKQVVVTDDEDVMAELGDNMGGDGGQFCGWWLVVVLKWWETYWKNSKKTTFGISMTLCTFYTENKKLKQGWVLWSDFCRLPKKTKTSLQKKNCLGFCNNIYFQIFRAVFNDGILLEHSLKSRMAMVKASNPCWN